MGEHQTPADRRGDVVWTFEPVALPPSKNITIDKLEAQLKAGTRRFLLEKALPAWRGCVVARPGKRIDVACLKLGRARILHLPGEPFVEYQLAAKAERPDLFLAVAGYGDYAPWYIGTSVAYEQGGYETSPPPPTSGRKVRQSSQGRSGNCWEDENRPKLTDVGFSREGTQRAQRAEPQPRTERGCPHRCPHPQQAAS